MSWSDRKLDELALQTVEALLRAGESDHTVRSYGSALRYWAAWYQVRYGKAIQLPVSERAVIQFIVDHAIHPETGAASLPAALDAQLVAGGPDQA